MLSPKKCYIQLAMLYRVRDLILHVINIYYYLITCGPGSSVGLVTDYRLDGPGSNPIRDEIFCLSKLALGPTQTPVKWVLGLSWE